MNEFQDRLQELLIENNINRLGLAKAINVSSTTINGYFNNGYYPHIDVAIKIANHFSCSLDYLFGLSDNRTKMEFNNNSFIDNFDKILKENKMSIATAFKNMKMSEYNYYRWKAGMFPKTINIIEIAKFFNVSTDFLIGNAKS